MVPKQKVTLAKNDSQVSLSGARDIPTAAIEEEIARKDYTQRAAKSTGNKVVISRNDTDELVGRK